LRLVLKCQESFRIRAFAPHTDGPSTNRMGFFALESVLAAAANTITIGLLFSTTGPYAALGREGLDGALFAVEEINKGGTCAFALRTDHRDPAGVTERYAGLARDLLGKGGARHIVGCTTSWSRKEVIPVLEKHGAMLWYPCPYEGFECNEQVIYLGACPNQHILPLLQYILPRFGTNGYLVGSNYIWGWETNRIARDILEQSGGAIVGERYAPLGDVDIGHIIRDIRAKRPAFVVNTLIGPSSYAFLRAYRDLGISDPDFAMARRPVLSCNLAEREAASLGDVAEGLYTIAPYFQDLSSEANRQFLKRVGTVRPSALPVSAFFAQAYSAVHILAAGLSRAGTDESRAVLGAMIEREMPTPFGRIRISAANNHAALKPHIARVLGNGRLTVIEHRRDPILPDPYLAHTNLVIGNTSEIGNAAGHLRVVK
jgi:branched-chain amino acid transport system substrate-binding protein